ncbi:alpha/beta fold hydrolase [Pannonibacter carbonis]|uniref:alpha/beta fold hydrolase n=1 Tax=Pannonibacter carbonis TaxID=2067569 RepID=UPI000D0E8139|nr:alpha/beta hydrolase [Pannonibacter carbonis]
MQTLADLRCSVVDHLVPTDQGFVSVRQWQPQNHSRAAGVPIILLHDSLGCIDLWRDLPERIALAIGRKVIAYDRIGFGRSSRLNERPPANFVTLDATGELATVLDALGIAEFVVVGHSVGGGMALAAGAVFGARCRAVITISAQSFLEDLTRAGIRKAAEDFADPQLKARLEKYHGPRTDWVLDAWIGSWLSPAFDDWCLDAEIGRITSPVLTIHGALDEYGSPAQPQRIARTARVPVSALLLPDAGHFPHRSHETQTLKAIIGFLAQVL